MTISLVSSVAKNRRSVIFFFFFAQQMKRSAQFSRLIDNQPTSISFVRQAKQYKWNNYTFSPIVNISRYCWLFFFFFFCRFYLFVIINWLLVKYLLERRTAVEYVQSLENPMQVVWLAGKLETHELDSFHSKWSILEVITAKRPQLDAVLHSFRRSRKFLAEVIIWFPFVILIAVLAF